MNSPGSSQSADGHLTAAEVRALEPVVRRVIAARVRDPASVDDLVQDVFERLLRARRRLAAEALAPYAVVTARNLVISRARRDGRERPVPELDEEDVSVGPAEAAIMSEQRSLLATALERMPPAERHWLVAHHGRGAPVAELSAGGPSAATVRVRLARARAKLRVEYALVAAGVELPTARCRPALVALAGGERSRQATAARHLLQCSACASVGETVVERRLPAVVLLPLLAARWLGRTAAGHPAVSAVATVSAAAVAAGAVVTLSGPVRPARTTSPTSVTTVSKRPAGWGPLHVDGHPLRLTEPALHHALGHVVTADRANVEAVVTHDGFWVGTSRRHRVFVELVGPLRALRVRVGDRVSFEGRLVAQPRDYPRLVGVTSADGAAQLAAEGVHLAVRTTALKVAAST